MLSRARALTIFVALIAFVGCSEHAQKTVERTASPLIGTWTRDGNTTSGNDNGGPQFTKLTFAANGSLAANYLAVGLGAVIGSGPKIKAENDTYTTHDVTLQIAEGTTHRDYTFRVDGTKLYLMPPGGGDAAVFTKSS